MDASPRVGIQNISKLPREQYQSLFIENGDQMMFRYRDAKIKVDGIPLRFGFDEWSDPFVETSRSGPIYSSMQFVEHVQKKPDSNPRKPWMIETAYKYERLASLILSQLQLVPKQNRLHSLKVHAECLPRHFQDDMGRVVTLPYQLPADENLILYPYDVQGSSFDPLHEAARILVRETKGPYELRLRMMKSIRIQDDHIKLPLLNFDGYPYPDELEEAILSTVNPMTQYGPIEGVIIPTRYNEARVDVKVQSEIYKQARAKQKFQLVVEE